MNGWLIASLDEWGPYKEKLVQQVCVADMRIVPWPEIAIVTEVLLGQLLDIYIYIYIYIYIFVYTHIFIYIYIYIYI